MTTKAANAIEQFLFDLQAPKIQKEYLGSAKEEISQPRPFLAIYPFRTWAEYCDANGFMKSFHDADIRTLTIPSSESGSFKDKALKYLASPHNLLLVGQAGSGKTHFMVALLRELMRKNICTTVNTRILRMKHIEEKFSRAMEQFSSTQYEIDLLCEPDYLLIDDLGVERQTEKMKSDLLEIIGQRLDAKKVTIITTNIQFEDIADRYGERIYSRLKPIKIIKFPNKDQRESIKL